MERLQSAVGVFALIALAWAISENRRAVSWRHAALGLAVTVALAALLIKVPPVKVSLPAPINADSACSVVEMSTPRFIKLVA